MKTKYGWSMWSNGHVNLFYLESDACDFNRNLMAGDINGMIGASVAEESPESGIMKRTQHGRELFIHHVRTRDALTNEIKRLNKNDRISANKA